MDLVRFNFVNCVIKSCREEVEVEMNIEEIFGIRVFDDAAMRKRLPERVYESLSRTRRLGENLDPSIADVVACAMKDWAIEQGATHYSHWFQPMNLSLIHI